MKSLINKKSFNVVLVLLSGILWGTIGIYTTALNTSGLSSISITAVRSLLTAIMLGIFILVYNKKLFKIRLKDLPYFFGMGVISFAFFNVCYFKSMQLNKSLGTAAILLYTAPIFVCFLSAVLFKEKINLTKLICLALAVAGCILVSGGGNITFLGLLFGLGSGFGYALYSIFSVYALKNNNFFTAIFYAFVLATICLAPLCQWGAVITCIKADFSIFLYILGIAFFTTVLPYILYTCGLKVVPAGEASVIACIEPLVAALIGFFVFNQTMKPLAIIGIVLILGAVIILSRPKKA